MPLAPSTLPRTLFLLLLVIQLGGCASIGYYTQAIGGHFEILGRARPIDDVLADPATHPALRARLALLREARAFAVHELHLPDNPSYQRYADLGRPYALWNVFAAPALSLEPRQWCYPVAGCVGYRGYFARADAERMSAELRAEGYDVFLGGVRAYSTLGWFDDPLLSTMLGDEHEAAALMFHELAHQQLYVRDATALNESFAVVVEVEGMRRWLHGRGELSVFAHYLEARARRDALMALALRHRARLHTLYGSDLPTAEKLATKQEILDDLRRDYGALKKSWGGDNRFDGWIGNDLNNAKLAAIGLYHEHVPALRALMARHKGDLPGFYRAVAALGRLPPAERRAALARLASTN